MTKEYSGYACATYKEAFAFKNAVAYLYSLPVNNPERQKLWECVPGDAESLDRRTRRFLTLCDEYQARRVFEKIRNGPWPQSHIHWSRLLTRQSPPKAFESGSNVLPGMEKWR